MRKFATEKRILAGLGFLILLAFLFSSFTLYKSFNLEPGEEVIAPGGITIVKPSNNIVDATLDNAGILTVKYEDGTTKQVGYVTGPRGEDGQSIPPTQAQIAAAVLDYCTTNSRCDAKEPTAAQVATAVTNYCAANNQCKGDRGDTGSTGATGSNGANGADGQSPTTEQIMAAVADYCSTNNNCKGDTGDQGVPGNDGRDPVISCVTRNDGQFVAWKYATEAIAAYRNLYELPVLSQGQDCVDLRSA